MLKISTSPGAERGGQPAVSIALLNRRGVVVEPHQTVAIGVHLEIPVRELRVFVAVLQNHQRTLVGSDVTERDPRREMPFGPATHVRAITMAKAIRIVGDGAATESQQV